MSPGQGGRRKEEHPKGGTAAMNYDVRVVAVAGGR